MKRKWLIQIRTKRGLSQEEISEKLNIPPSTYSAYENGTRTPKPKRAKLLGKIFGFDWTKFYEEV